MKIRLFILMFSLLTAAAYTQGLKMKNTGVQTFDFADTKNQVSFFSGTPLEDITGISNEVKGKVTFDPKDITTMKGKISIPTSSLKTGIKMRDGHLQSDAWLNADDNPEITFTILKVSDIKTASDNKVSAKVTGNFTAHGVTREVITNATITYIAENEQTRSRAPGDLLGVQSKFNIKLSDYGIDNKLIGQKVAEDVEITVNIVGSNAR